MAMILEVTDHEYITLKVTFTELSGFHQNVNSPSRPFII